MNKFFGVLSLLLICIAILSGLFAIANASFIITVFYGLIVCSSSLLITYAFCTKCECRIDSCGHVFPGKLTKIFPDREQTEYSITDYLLTFISLLLIIIFPQFWLLKIKYLFILFWILLSIAGAIIFLFVCNKCDNKKCPACRNI